MEFLELQKHADTVGLVSGAAESHGMLCGLASGGTASADGLWLSELLAELDERDLLVQECKQALHGVAAETLEAFNGPGLGFSLMLPDDDVALVERVQALRDWSQGFLYGLGLADISVEGLSVESAEALRDMTEIARLDADGLSGEEADEEAYAELAEFVWVAALMIQADLAQQVGDSDDSE